MGQDDICQNCNYFFLDSRESDLDFGVCLRDEAFEIFLDDIMESSNFACCNDLYLEKRFNGEKTACSNFEEAEIIEVSGEDDIYAYLLNEALKYQNVDGIIEKLYNSDNVQIEEAITSLSAYIVIGNNNAYEGLIKYYTGLPPADSLEDVHKRVRMVKALANRLSKTDTINALVNELARTPSNNTTRQLYTEILTLLSECPAELVKEPLLQLLDMKKHSHKIKKKIYGIIDF